MFLSHPDVIRVLVHSTYYKVGLSRPKQMYLVFSSHLDLIGVLIPAGWYWCSHLTRMVLRISSNPDVIRDLVPPGCNWCSCPPPGVNGVLALPRCNWCSWPTGMLLVFSSYQDTVGVLFPLKHYWGTRPTRTVGHYHRHSRNFWPM